MAELQTQSSIEAHALARHVRMSPQKARLVMDLIRGQKAQAALQTLRFTPKRAAKHIEKVLRSAIANDGPRMKRIRPAPMGRAYRYQRRMAHIEIALAERLRAGANGAATVVGEEAPAAKKRASGRRPAPKKTASKKAKAKG